MSWRPTLTVAQRQLRPPECVPADAGWLPVERRLPCKASPGTIPGMADPAADKLDSVLAALAQLTTVVGSLAESVAHMADHPSGPAATPERAPVQLVEDVGYAPLTPRSPENQGERVSLALMLDLVGTPAGAELLAHGARGFFRKLEREDGQMQLGIPRDIALLMIEQAGREDVREAQEMSEELLKVWAPTDMPVAGVDAPTVAVSKDGVAVATQRPPL